MMLVTNREGVKLQCLKMGVHGLVVLGFSFVSPGFFCQYLGLANLNISKGEKCVSGPAERVSQLVHVIFSRSGSTES